MGPKALLAALLTVPMLASGATAQELSARFGARFGNGQVSASYRSPTPAASSAARGYRRGAAVRSTHFRGRVWIPGRYVLVPRRVWVPGCNERVWVEPVYEITYDHCGNEVQILVCAGYWKSVFRPGHYVVRDEQIWEPGHWRRRY